MHVRYQHCTLWERQKADSLAECLILEDISCASECRPTSTYTRHKKTECATEREAHPTCHDTFGQARLHACLHLMSTSTKITWRIRLDHTILTVACSCWLIPPPAAPPKGGMPGKVIFVRSYMRLERRKVLDPNK